MNQGAYEMFHSPTFTDRLATVELVKKKSIKVESMNQ